MKLTLSVFLLLSTAALLLVGCSGASKPSPAPPPTPAPAPAPAPTPAAPPAAENRPAIVCLGDSLTAGLGVPPDAAYPARLQAKLNDMGYRYRVVNAGISGDTTAGGLSRIDALLERSPALLLIELGANDGLRGLPLDQAKQNLSQMIERAQAKQVPVVLAGMQIPPNYGPDYANAFRQMYLDLAQKYKVPLIPFLLEGVAARPELNQPDGIHPTAEGYKIVTENVAQTLIPLLKNEPLVDGPKNSYNP